MTWKAMQCGAKTRSGAPCKSPAMENGRCRMHGGKHPRGIASPHYKTGRYSKAMPARLSARYSASQADPRLLELRDDISLVDARLEDLLSRVESGESGALWQRLMGARGDLIAAKKAGDQVGQVAALNLILDLIAAGHADYQAWREIGAALEQRRKLVESERKRLIEAQATLTSEQAMLLMGALLAAVKANVSDRSALSAIQTEFLRLTNAEDAATTE
jgi:galactokinase